MLDWEKFINESSDLPDEPDARTRDGRIEVNVNGYLDGGVERFEVALDDEVVIGFGFVSRAEAVAWAIDQGCTLEPES